MSQAIDFTVGLRHCDNQTHIFIAVLRQFVSQYQQPLPLLQQDIDEQDELRELHTLKGLCATIGADSLSASAQRYYQSWQQLNPQQRREAVAELNLQREYLIGQVNDYLSHQVGH